MISAFLSSFKCWEIVGCASPNSSARLPQTHAFFWIICCRIAILAGWAKTFIIWAILFCLTVNISVFVNPILSNKKRYYDIFLLQYVIRLFPAQKQSSIPGY